MGTRDYMQEAEQAVGEYINRVTEILPKYILMDTTTLEDFSKTFYPRERIPTLNSAFPPKIKMLKLNSAPWGIEVKEVVSATPVFEVVG